MVKHTLNCKIITCGAPDVGKTAFLEKLINNTIITHHELSAKLTSSGNSSGSHHASAHHPSGSAGGAANRLTSPRNSVTSSTNSPNHPGNTTAGNGLNQALCNLQQGTLTQNPLNVNSNQNTNLPGNYSSNNNNNTNQTNSSNNPTSTNNSHHNSNSNASNISSSNTNIHTSSNNNNNNLPHPHPSNPHTITNSQLSLLGLPAESASNFNHLFPSSTKEDIYLCTVNSERGPATVRIHDTPGSNWQEKHNQDVPKHYYHFGDGFLLFFDLTNVDSFKGRISLRNANIWIL